MLSVVFDNFMSGTRSKSRLLTVCVVLTPIKHRELMSNLHAAACSAPHGSHVEGMAVLFMRYVGPMWRRTGCDMQIGHQLPVFYGPKHNTDGEAAWTLTVSRS